MEGRWQLRFWSRRSDEDDPAEPLFDADQPPPFTLRETGRRRDMDGDEGNAWAPWWDVEVEVTGLEAPSEEEAWAEVEKHARVIEKKYAALVVTPPAPVELKLGDTTFYEVEGLSCPKCSNDLSMSKAERGAQRAPRPDDNTVCSFCLSYLRYVEASPGKLGLDPMSPDEFEALQERDQGGLMQVRAILEARRRESGAGHQGN